MSSSAKASLALALLMAVVPSSAAAQSIATIVPGETRTKPAGNKVDLYRFGSVAGATVKLTLAGSGEAALVLYTPTGEEMLSSRGNANVTLSAIMPLNDVFSFAVIRENHTKPYKITFESKEPDEDFAGFATDVGYKYTWKHNGYVETQCWIDPGYKLRVKGPRTVSEVTLGRDGRKYYVDTRGERSIQYSSQTIYTPIERITTYTSTTGKTETERQPYNQEPKERIAEFVSYLCSE